MDPLSHALIGGLSAKTVKVSPRRFWIMTLLGMAPDIDVVFSLFGSWAAMLQHRGLSHSLIGVLFQILFYAWALSRWDTGPFRERVLHYSLPFMGHIAGDLLTYFGVPLFLPFSMREYSLDLIGSVNFIPLILMAGGILWMHKKDLEGWRHSGLLWGVWVIYLSLIFSGKTYASKLMAGPNVVALPTNIHSMTWRAIQIDPDHQLYHTYSVNLLKKTPEDVRNVPMPSAAFPVQASMVAPEVQRFLRENRWPVVRFSEHPNGWTVEWGTLMFSARGLVRGRVLVEVSPEGKILSEQPIFKFWNPELAS